MEGIKALTESHSGKWYETGKELAKSLTREHAQNLIWNLGYLRQGVMDVAFSNNASQPRDSQPEKVG